MNTRNIFTRSKLNPIISSKNTEWWKIYNPGAAIGEQGKIHLFPRVNKREVDWHSRIVHGVSTDGENFLFDKEPVLTRSGASEIRGLEDPRVTFVDSKYYMLFAAYDGKQVLLHSAVSNNLEGPWQRNGSMLPDFDFFKNGGKMVRWEHGKPVEKTSSTKGNIWTKSGALFPERINGKLSMIFGEYCMWFASSQDGKKYEVEHEPIMTARKGTTYFDNTFIEMGPPPILTEKGWLVLYHGIDEAFRYQLGFAILDKADPKRIVFRSSEPIFSPQAEYEIGDSLIDVIDGGIDVMSKMTDEELKEFYKKARNNNIIPQVVFCPGVIVKDNELRIYYGAGDTTICTATASLKAILDIVP